MRKHLIRHHFTFVFSLNTFLTCMLGAPFLQRKQKFARLLILMKNAVFRDLQSAEGVESSDKMLSVKG